MRILENDNKRAVDQADTLLNAKIQKENDDKNKINDILINKLYNEYKIKDNNKKLTFSKPPTSIKYRSKKVLRSLYFNGN